MQCSCVWSAALPSSQSSFPRRDGHGMHCKRACRTGEGSLSAVARRHSPEGRRRPCLSVSRSRVSVLPWVGGAAGAEPPFRARDYIVCTACSMHEAGGWCADGVHVFADHLFRRLTIACFLPSFLACAAEGIPGKAVSSGCFQALKRERAPAAKPIPRREQGIYAARVWLSGQATNRQLHLPASLPLH